MFELTFGKLIVVICATTTAVGKAGVPPLAKSLGYQFGRVVGLLQGVKVKLEDVVDSNSEIKEMGKELHSELRKLDSVRTEFAIAAGSVGGGGVGNMLRNRAVSNLTASSNTHTTAAVVESSWGEKSALKFTSVGETHNSHSDNSSPLRKSGADLLNDIIQENLVHQHYDKVVEKQELATQRERAEMKNRKEKEL
ncbi:hypothetical protein ScalyP_jg10140 [Parmales sp. scaly parma]|nr:hypothetical protein ScalyP_jg10140 [Parmales sp. scaly parma]